MNRRSLIIALSFASGFCLIFYIVACVGLLLVVNLLGSAASILDPLHAERHVSAMWTGFVAALVFQTVFSAAIAPSVAITAASIERCFESGWLYPTSAAASLLIHLVLLVAMGTGVHYVTGNDLFATFLTLFVMFVFISAPLLGIGCAVIIRRKSRPQNPNQGGTI